MANNDTHFLDELLEQIEQGVQSYTQSAYEQLVSILSPVFIALVTLYIVVQGIRLYLGNGDHSVLSYIKQTLMLVFIALLAMNWDWFSILVVDFVTRGPDELISGLIPNNNDEESVTGFFTSFFDESIGIFIELFQSGGWSNFSAYFVGIIGVVAVLVLTTAIFILLVSAEVLLSVLLVLTPFIIPLYIFEVSRSICLSWARMLISTMFVPILVFAISGLFVDILYAQLEIIKEDEIDYYNLAAYLAIVIICALLIRQIPALAAGLGGSITAVTTAPNVGKAMIGGFKNLYDTAKQSYAKNLKTSQVKPLEKTPHADKPLMKAAEPSSPIILLPTSKLSGYGGKTNL